MTRQLVLTRTEAEFLVDLLENPGPVTDPCRQGQYLADEIRELFGMGHARDDGDNILYTRGELPALLQNGISPEPPRAGATTVRRVFVYEYPFGEMPERDAT